VRLVRPASSSVVRSKAKRLTVPVWGQPESGAVALNLVSTEVWSIGLRTGVGGQVATTDRSSEKAWVVAELSG